MTPNSGWTEDTAVGVALGAIGMLVVGVALLRLVAWLRGRAITRQRREQGRRAVDGELRAMDLLEACGFEVLERQSARRYMLVVDGERVPVDVRADYLVRGGALRYVAEVKTGRHAPRWEFSSTRRQLLEYRVAYGVDGVLLVDAESGQVRSVEFPLPSGPSKTPLGLLSLVLLLGMAFGVALAYGMR